MEGASILRKLVVEGGSKIIDFDNKAFKPVPEEGIQLAVDAMRRGVIYRYQPKTAEQSLTANFEKKFAEFMGVKHAVAMNSCGSAMFIALNIAGVQPGDKILSNAFTFHAVPSVIHHARAEPVLVETTREWGIDPDDLDRKAAESGAKVFLMSYMRGHVPDLERVLEVVNKHNLLFIEDCAHAYCTDWEGKPLGTLGAIGCFSTQSSKGLSAGEGGIFITNNDEFAAKAVLYAGSYETLWKKHFNLDHDLMNDLQNKIPGYSMRMHEVAAAMLLPQIDRLPSLRTIHTDNYERLEAMLEGHPNIEIPKCDPRVTMFNDTMQFHLIDLSREQAVQFIDVAKMEGLPMQVFGIRRNARDFRQWEYITAHKDDLPQTIENIDFAVDLSLQPHLTSENIDVIGQVIIEVLHYVTQ